MRHVSRAVAANRPSRGDGHDCGASQPGGREGAAGPEIAAGILVDQVGQSAGDRDQPPADAAADPRQRGEQTARIGMQGPGSTSRRPGFDGAPGIEHGHAVADFLDDAEIVAHQQQRQAAPGAQLFQEVEDLRLHGDVERRGGFVEQQQFGLGGQGGRDHDALLHAAGKLVRIGAHHRGARGMPVSASNASHGRKLARGTRR